MVMTYFFNIYINVDIFTIVFYLPYYCNIRYVVLSFFFDEIRTHYYYYYYYYRHTNPITYIKVESMFLPTLDGICKFETLNKNNNKKTEQLLCNENGTRHLFKQTDRHGKLECQVSTSGARCDGRWFPLTFFHFSK